MTDHQAAQSGATRLFVAGPGADGRSSLVGAPPPAVFQFTADTAPDWVPPVDFATTVTELWAKTEAPTWDNVGETDRAASPADLTFVPGGFRWCTVELSPDCEFALHDTPSVDYDVVVSGSLELLLEDGSATALVPGDCVVVSGVKHGWRVGPDGATIACFVFGLPADKRD